MAATGLITMTLVELFTCFTRNLDFDFLYKCIFHSIYRKALLVTFQDKIRNFQKISFRCVFLASSRNSNLGPSLYDYVIITNEFFQACAKRSRSLACGTRTQGVWWNRTVQKSFALRVAGEKSWPYFLLQLESGKHNVSLNDQVRFY